MATTIPINPTQDNQVNSHSMLLWEGHLYVAKRHGRGYCTLHAGTIHLTFPQCNEFALSLQSRIRNAQPHDPTADIPTPPVLFLKYQFTAIQCFCSRILWRALSCGWQSCLVSATCLFTIPGLVLILLHQGCCFQGFSPCVPCVLKLHPAECNLLPRWPEGTVSQQRPIIQDCKQKWATTDSNTSWQGDVTVGVLGRKTLHANLQISTEVKALQCP